MILNAVYQYNGTCNPIRNCILNIDTHITYDVS